MKDVRILKTFLFVTDCGICLRLVHQAGLLFTGKAGAYKSGSVIGFELFLKIIDLTKNISWGNWL